MRHSLQISVTIVVVAMAAAITPAAFAQCDLSGSPMTSLRTPLILGAPNTPPYQQAPEGQPPPPGDGPVPMGVTPGMTGPPTLLPSMPVTPANHIDYPSYAIPFSPANLSAPGELGPSTWAPPPPSTPGWDPGSIRAPRDFYRPPAREVNIFPGGGIPGGAPTQRWGGQTTADFGRYKYDGTRTCDFGQQAIGTCSQDGPWQTLPGALATQDRFGRRMPLRNALPTTQTVAPY